MKYRFDCKILSPEEEEETLIEYYQTKNKKLAEKLLLSNYKLIVQTAMKFQNYGLPLEDLIQEGCVGFSLALEKFDINRKLRLNTYALYWIKAYIMFYIYKNFFICRYNSTPTNVKLFYKFRKLKQEFSELGNFDISNDEVLEKISKHLNIGKEHVEQINNLLMNKESSNIDSKKSLIDPENSPEEKLIEKNKYEYIMKKFQDLKLNDTKKTVFMKYFINPKQETFETLGKELNLSKTKTRQIYNNIVKQISKINHKENLALQ